MRPASTHFATSRFVGIFCPFAVIFAVAGLASGQAAGAKRKLFHQAPPSQLASQPASRAAKPNATSKTTTDTWTGNGSNADWSNASNWNNGAITTGENILINLTTAATTVDASFTVGTLTLSNSGDSVTVNPGVVLTAGGLITNAGTITDNGTLTAQAGISNTGTLALGNNTVLNITGNITNSGSMTLNSTGNFTELILTGNVTLSGGGTVTLSNNANNYIFGATSLNQLTNQETIQGAGQIGHGQMALVNSGTINANQSAGMTIDVNDGLTNTGTIEATGGNTLQIVSTTDTDTGGTILANASTVQINSSTVNGGALTVTGAGQLQLNSATVVGGTLTNSATGTINIASGTDVLAGTINNSAGGLFEIGNNATLDLAGGTYSQLGTVQLNSSGNFTELVLQGNVTLSGGSVTLSNNTQNYIFGQYYTDTLTNEETISGAGQIGHGQVTLVNTGTINSNQSSGITIDANGGATNTGTIEATSGSTLQLASTTVNNAGGTISANSGTLQVNSSTINGGTISLTGSSSLQLNTATIHGGSTLTNSATGTIDIASGTNVMGGTINNSAGGLFEIANNATLNLEGGTYSQLGTVQLNSSGNFTQLVLSGNVTLSGGTVTMSNNSQNYIFGQISGDTLTNQETIQGAGQIGHGQMTLVNSGTINSNQSAGITLDANYGVTNTGTLEATSGSTLILQSSTVNNTGGTITANTGTLNVSSSTINGGAVTLVGSSSLQLNTSNIHDGSAITNSSTGTIDIASGSNTMGGTINNSAGGLFEISNNATLYLAGGTYSQLGTVQLNSSGNFTQLILDGNVTLSGGSVTLSNNSQNYIFGQISTDTLTNEETISGAGQIGHGQMTLVNSGTINSNQSSGMTIQANNGVTNTGTLEATSGSTLILSSTGIINNTGGTITANTGTVQLNSSNINGGAITLVGASELQLNTGVIHGGSIITNSSTGAIDIASGTNILGGTINNSAGGLLEVSNNATLGLDNGTYSQLGNVQLNSTGNFTQLVIEGNVTLSGGTVTMSANPNNYIFGAGSFDVLTNQETIQGAGNIGNGQMGLVNSGSIIANASGNLLINVSGLNFNNTGIVEANGATLTIEGPGVTFLTNDNHSTATLTGGTYIADGANIEWNAGANNITTLAANVTEEGGGELFNTCTGTGCSSNMLAGLTSITSTGSLTIGGLPFTDAGSFSNAGSLTLLSGETFTVGSLAQISGGSLTAGTYVLDANLNLSGTAQAITTNAANLTLAGGTIENTSNSTNALAGLATNSGKLTIGGSSNNVSTTAASFSNTGTLTINSGDSLTAAKLTQISGTTLSAGTYVLGGNLDLTTSGISVKTNSATLTLQGGTIKSNGVNALSALASNTKSLTIAGASNNVSTSAASFSNTGTLTINAGDSFTAPALTQISGNTLSAGTYTLAGNLDLTGAASVTTNSATLTLEGGTIQTGSTNDLANLAANTKTLTLTNNAGFTTSASFANSGAVDVASGSTFTVSGSSGYTQSAGTTTVDGTLANSGTGITVSGGTLLGAGTLNGNVSNSATINVGDSGKAGLLSITGTYTQLSSGTLSVSIGGTTVGTLYSELKISGAASLGGTLSAALISGFTPKIGQTFTILAATGGLGGTEFTNSTIAINSNEQFNISYTSTGVVLTVASTASKSNTTSELSSKIAVAAPKQAVKGTVVKASNTLGHAISTRIAKGVQVASVNESRAILSDPSSHTLRVWEHVPVAPSWDHVQTTAIGRAPRPVDLTDARSDPAHHVNTWEGSSRALPVRSPLNRWTGIATQEHPLPARILPRIRPVIR
jgi:hypothetical protein